MWKIPKVDVYEEVIVDSRAEKLYQEMIQLLDDLSNPANWESERVIQGGYFHGQYSHVYDPHSNENVPWRAAGRVKDLFERYIEAVTKVRRRNADQD